MAALTGFYMFRIVFMTFFGKPRSEAAVLHERERLRVEEEGSYQAAQAMHELLESVVYRLTPGRRYLATAFRDLTRSAAPNLAAIEAWPASGSMLVEYDSGQLHGIPERTPDPDRPDPAMAVGIERGGPNVHDRAAALRDMGAVAIEQRIERALGAWPRSWLADYV